ncbi:hypothetical protein RYH80_11275 [Halobaculum sp. MBLA0147]|uniref:hypothetical protein n=1 Tax=Halobaculum sp. MBLA0147 TaxID=3079934 RepID=UPI0035257BC0
MVRFGPPIDPPSDGTETTLFGETDEGLDLEPGGDDVSLDEVLESIGVDEP